MIDPQPAPPAPAAVAYVRDLLRGLDAPWFLCGGWAADDWLGRRTREHWDVDIAVFHDDQRAIFAYLPGWALVGHDPNVPDDTTEQWNGRQLDPPAHIHVPRLGSSLSTSPELTHSEFEFEFLLNERAGQEWILNREKGVTVSLERHVRQSSWGPPTVAPEIVLFHKAGGHLTAAELKAGGDGPRPRDEQDFFAVLPTLAPAQRTWLRDTLATARPAHPWLAHL